MYPACGGPIGFPVGVTINIIFKNVVSTLDKSCQVGLKIQDFLMVKWDKTNMEGGTKPKGGRFQQSTSTRKASLKAPTTGPEYKVLHFGK